MFKKITFVGRNAENSDVAADDAIDRAEETLAGVHWVEVKEFGVELAPVEARKCQARVKAALELEGKDDE